MVNPQQAINLLEESGLEVSDIEDDPVFAARRLHPRDPIFQMQGLQRLANTFLEHPDSLLQVLVNTAVELCGADSAGISVERPDSSEEEFYHWLATAGQYSGFLNAMLPRYPSACGVCLERGRPQHFRVHRRFFEILGVDAPLVADGILLPWQVEQTRGTIFIMAHIRSEAFDSEDARMMKIFADFAALAIRQQRQQKLLLAQAGAAAAAAMANELAHQINNPLQGMTNLFYLAEHGYHGPQAQALGREAAEGLDRLSTIVRRLLSLPPAARFLQ